MTRDSSFFKRNSAVKTSTEPLVEKQVQVQVGEEVKRWVEASMVRFDLPEEIEIAVNNRPVRVKRPRIFLGVNDG